VCGAGRSQWRARRGGCPAGRGRPSSPRRGRQCAPRGGRTRTPHGVRSRTMVARDMPRVPRPCARPRRAKKKSSPPPPHGGLTRRHGGLFEAPSADPPWSPCVTRAPGEDDFFVRPAGLSGARDAARASAFGAPGFDTLRGLGRPQRLRRDVSACICGGCCQGARARRAPDRERVVAGGP